MLVYPYPELVITGDEIDPLEMLTVAVAVDPIPIPITGGREIFTGIVVPVYPDPTEVIVNAEIVPETETVAVNAADTGSSFPLTIKASKLLTVIGLVYPDV